MEQGITTLVCYFSTRLREARYFKFPRVRQQKLAVFHVEPRNESLSVATDHRAVGLLLSVRLPVVFEEGFKGQSHTQQFACVIFIRIKDVNQFLRLSGSTQKHGGQKPAQPHRWCGQANRCRLHLSA